MLVIPKDDLQTEQGFNKPTKVLSKNRRYLVYAVGNIGGQKSYYIIDDTKSRYPIGYPSTFFTVVKEGVPDIWKTVSSGVIRKKYFSSFPKWVDTPHFYERLVDANPGSEEEKLLDEFSSILKSLHKLP